LAKDRSGQILGGRYELVGLLDKGGQGSVYRALDRRAGDYVAIKVLAESWSNRPDWRERMFREARALTSLTGTAAVRVLDQGWTDDHSLYLVMELLQGFDLETYMDRLEKSGQHLPLNLVTPIFGPVVETLELAHDRGILHRDLKPANIFLIERGGVRLLDFGFAKFVRERGLTAAGFIAGSPSFIAPEIWKDSQSIDQRIDVYSLAAVIFRVLAGRPPFFHKELVEILKMVTTAPRPSLHQLRPDLPASVDDWVQQALAIDPADRFMRVRAMWNALRGTLGT
jgi:serine/threonine-protein kinase